MVKAKGWIVLACLIIPCILLMFADPRDSSIGRYASLKTAIDRADKDPGDDLRYAGSAAAAGTTTAKLENKSSKSAVVAQPASVAAAPEDDASPTAGDGAIGKAAAQTDAGTVPGEGMSPEDFLQLSKISPPSPPLAPVDPETDPEEYNYRNFKASKRCPGYRIPSGKTADGKVVQEAISKYTRYTSDYCNKTGMLQMHVGLSKFVYFMDIIAKIVGLKKGDKIMDWGCGCGTMLNYYHLKFQTQGVGVDFTRSAIDHARSHSQPNQTFCWMDGTNLKHFEPESFDAIVSWAVLYHVRRTLVQCEVVHQMVKLLKPGGSAYIGHLRTEKTQEYWRKKNKCRVPGAQMTRYRDYKTFHMGSFRKHQFFSIVIRKDGPNVTAGSGSGVGAAGKVGNGDED